MPRLSWKPEANIPSEYLQTAKPLLQREFVSQVEVLELCLLAIRLIDSEQPVSRGRRGMSSYIADIWFSRDALDDDSLLEEICCQFRDWEIEGRFDFNNKLNVAEWERTKNWVAKAEERLIIEPSAKDILDDIHKDIPLEFLKIAKTLIPQDDLAKADFMELCTTAIKLIDNSRITSHVQQDMFRCIANLWLRHASIKKDHYLNMIGGQCADWASLPYFDAKDLPSILYWKRLKSWVSKAQIGKTHE